MFNIDISALSSPIDDDSLVLQNSISLDRSIPDLEHTKNQKKHNFNRAPFSLESQMSVNEEVNMNQSPRWMSFRPMPRTKDPLVVEELPNSTDDKWKHGLIWKGVYFRLLLRADGLSLLEQIHLLKRELHPNISEYQYQISSDSLVCLDLAIMQLADLGTMFLFSTPVVMAETTHVKKPNSNRAFDQKLLNQESRLQVTLQANTLSMNYQRDQLTNAYLHLVLFVKRQNTDALITGLIADSRSSCSNPKVLSSENILGYLSTEFPTIERSKLKRYLSLSLLKSFKGNFSESTFI